MVRLSLLSDQCVAKAEALVPPASLENPPATGVRSAALGLFASVAHAQDCSNAVRPPPPRACARAQLRWKAASPRLCPQNIVDDSSDSVNVADLLGLLAAYGRSGCAPCTCGGAVRARGPVPSLDCLSRWPTAQLPHPNPRAAPQDLDASGEVDVVDLLALLGAFGDVDCPCPIRPRRTLATAASRRKSSASSQTGGLRIASASSATKGSDRELSACLDDSSQSALHSPSRNRAHRRRTTRPESPECQP